MRFVKLVVEAFQGIGRAEIEFGPGLNVLYGENDLGKSTLASAVRAALLVVPGSSEADSYVSWYADRSPRVKLTFCDDDNHYWEVSKQFSSGASAELRHSKDGRQFTLDCKARAVEDKLRGLLRWGIPSPGGKGAPRGLPASFLANTLLASQTDVDGILKLSLDKDGDSSGKLRLQQALATLAQDPLFKRVLDSAQRECDTYFTETGRPKRGQGSKRVLADEAVKRWRLAVDTAKAQLDQSASTEEQMRAHRVLREELTGQVAEARDACAHARAGLVNAKARSAAAEQLAAARRVLTDMDVEVAKLVSLKTELQTHAKQVASLDSQVVHAQNEFELAEGQFRDAELDNERAQLEHGEQSRQLRKAELERELARLRERRTQLESQRVLAGRAIEAIAVLETKKADLTRAEHEKARVARELTSARNEIHLIEGEVELSRAMFAFVRWKQMSEQLEAAETSRRHASEQRAQAEKKTAEAAGIRSRAEDGLARLAERKARLPNAEELEFLERAERTLEKAEAALGGGLSVVVRAKKPVSLDAVTDQQSHPPVALTTEHTLVAERFAKLSVDDLVDIEVTAGGAEQRRAVEAARAVWKADCVLLLARAETASVRELKAVVAAVGDEERGARLQLGAVEKLDTEAKALRDRADLVDQQAVRTTPDAGELAARRAAVGSMSLEVLEERWAKGGKLAESRAEAECQRQIEQRRSAAEQIKRLEQAAALSEQHVKNSDEQVQQASQQAQADRQAVGDVDLQALVGTIDTELASSNELQAKAQAAIAALDAEHGDRQRRAGQAVEKARAVVEAKKAVRTAAQGVADAERTLLNQKHGELGVREQHVARLDRGAAAAGVEGCEAALAELPSSPVATEDDVQSAETELARAEGELSEAEKEFFKAEGALSKVGGAQLREQLQQAEDGLKAALAREHELNTDAQAWMLLREKLKSAENSEAAHLGRALGEPVGKRFAELTSHRYANLAFGPLLSATGLQATGVSTDDSVLTALSVGTRDQLATLVRLTIAHQIRSAIILDDHLVQTDAARLAWFRDMLLRTAVETQVVVFTCRPADYLRPEELPDAAVSSDFAGGTIRAVNLNGVVQRWEGAKSRM